MSPILAGLLPVPERCDACASDEIRKMQTRIGGEAWICDSCGAFVSCHDGTNIPVGFMADRETRQLRKEAHLAFDRLWKERLMSRDKAYLWLAFSLEIPRETMHISWLSKDQLRLATKLASEYYEANFEKLLTRKDRKDEKRGKRHVRENQSERRKIIERKRNSRT